MSRSWTPDDANDALKAADDAVIVTDMDGVVRFWNDAASTLYGWEPDEAVGRVVTDLLDPRGPGQGEGSLRRIASGDLGKAEFRARCKNGSVIPVLLRTAIVRDRDGVAVGLIGTSTDITDRVEAEAAAAAAKHRLDVVSAIAGIGTWEWDLVTGELDGDRSLSEMHGNDPDAGWSIDRWLASMHPDDRDQMLDAATADFANNGLMPEVKYRVAMPDGSTRVLLGRGEVVAWRDGVPTKLGGVVVDVTDSQRDAQRVLENLETMSDGFLSLDADWRIAYVNTAGERFLGATRDRLLGRVLWDAFPEALGTPFEHRYRTAVETGVGAEFEAYYPPHEAWYEIRAYPTDGMLAIYFRDINDRRAVIEAQGQMLAVERAARVAMEEASRQLEHAATHDPLTGLANRVALERHLERALAASDRTTALLFCDLDRFKYVNDSLGHSVGDQILIEVAARLSSCLREDDLVARIGGDEFVIALTIREREEARQVADRVIALLREPVEVCGRRLFTTISVGIAYSTSTTTPETLLRDADAAVYRSKDRGRNQASVFDDAVRAAAVARLEIEHDLRHALEGGELTVVYQPAFALPSGAVVGVEALVRWHHPTRGVVAPSAFIPLAEETGLIVPLGQRVLDIVTRDLAAHPVFDEDLTVWVNVSGLELAEETYVDGVRHRMGRMRGSIGLEVTETVLHEDPAAAGRALQALSAAGVQIAIDDFGTGYSSLARLAEYPINLVKIDQSFVAQLASRQHRAIVAAAIELSHALNARAVAEGVESADQLRGLVDLGCDQASGYYLARPVARDELAAAIVRGCRTIAAETAGAARAIGRT